MCKRGAHGVRTHSLGRHIGACALASPSLTLPHSPPDRRPYQRGQSVVSEGLGLSFVVRCVVEVIAVAMARVVCGSGEEGARSAATRVLSSDVRM